MNKKQVVKVETTVEYAFSNPQVKEQYGIAIDGEQVLLESGIVADAANQTIRSVKDSRTPVLGNKRAEVKVSATRNVPTEIRKSLEDGLASYVDLQKQLAVLEQAEKSVKSLMEFITKGMVNECRVARGVLTENEFAEEFMANLSKGIKAENNCLKFPYTAEARCGYIILGRSVDIEKYYRRENDMTYQEYDGCMSFRTDAEKSKTYKNFISKHTAPLSVKGAKFEEQLTLEDKDWLVYQGWYSIKLDENRPLTKEYAKEVADKFCGVKSKGKGYEKE